MVPLVGVGLAAMTAGASMALMQVATGDVCFSAAALGIVTALLGGMNLGLIRLHRDLIKEKDRAIDRLESQVDRQMGTLGTAAEVARQVTR